MEFHVSSLPSNDGTVFRAARNWSSQWGVGDQRLKRLKQTCFVLTGVSAQHSAWRPGNFNFEGN